MLHSDGKAEKLLWILAVLPTVVQCSAAVASPDSITTVPAGGSVHFPILHGNEDKYEVTLGKTSPNQLKILAWMSDQPESPYVIHPSYRNRIHFRRDGVIEMRGINMSDQGTYEVQTNYFGRELRNDDCDQFEIHVFESRNYCATVFSFIVLSVVVMLILGLCLLRKSVLIGQAHPETEGQESSVRMRVRTGEPVDNCVH